VRTQVPVPPLLVNPFVNPRVTDFSLNAAPVGPSPRGGIGI
jgi:hypothetical protein